MFLYNNSTRKVSRIFRRVDTDCDGFISYSDFLNHIVPLNPEFEAILNARCAKNANNDYSITELYSAITRSTLIDLFISIADVEEQLAAVRASYCVKHIC